MKFKIIIWTILLISSISLKAIDFTEAGAAKLELFSSDPVDYYKDNGFYRLTPQGTNQAGAIWANQTVDLDEPFLIEFIANFGDKDEYGADGIVFVFTKDPDASSPGLHTLIGGLGERIGYSGISNSLALEFDTYNNKPAPYNRDDISDDHFDIRRNGDLDSPSSYIKALVNECGNIENIENGKDIPIQIMWIPGVADKSKGQLVVYFNCQEIFNSNTETGNDEFIDIDDGLGWTDLKNVYFGLTAATGTEVNYHRVKLSDITLELSQEEFCSDVQLSASFPDFCGTVNYKWTASDGSTDGLINPNSKNPIATKSDTYTCEVSIEGTEFEWHSYVNNPIISESITAQVQIKKPDFSFSKYYGNSFVYSGQTVEVKDAICGASLSQDCGYLATAWSRYVQLNSSNIEETLGTGSWVLNFDYFGNIRWSNYLINSGQGIDLTNLSDIEKDKYGMLTVFHHSANFFEDQLLPYEKCSQELFSNEKLKKGSFLTGESKKLFSSDANDNLPNEIPNLMYALLDNEGKLIDSKFLDFNGYDVAYKSLQQKHNNFISYASDGSNLLFLNLEVNKTSTTDFNIDLTKQFKLSFNTQGFNETRSDLISLLVNNEYLNLTASTNDDGRIVISILNNITESDINNFLLKEKELTTGVPVNGLKNVKLVQSTNNPTEFYAVTLNQISKFTFNNNFDDFSHDFTYEIDYTNSSFIRDRLSGVTFDSDNDKLNILVSASDGQWLLDFDLVNKTISSHKYSSISSTFSDNLIRTSDGNSFVSHDNDDISLKAHNQLDLSCSVNDNITVNQVDNNNINLINSNLLTVTNPSFTELDSYLVELEHSPIDKSYNCLTIDDCECNDINQNSFELYYERQERTSYDEDCCYEVFIKNNGSCKFNNYDLNISQSVTGLTQNLAATQTITELLPSESFSLGTVCVPFGEEPLGIIISFSKYGIDCVDENQELITISEDLYCIEPCCDFIEMVFLWRNAQGGTCSWKPEYVFSDNMCNYDEVEVKYYDENDNPIELVDGFVELSMSSGDDPVTIKYVIYVNGMICDVRETDLMCRSCDCPPENVTSKWLSITKEKNHDDCEEDQCKVTVLLDLEDTYKLCYDEFKLNFKITDRFGNETEYLGSTENNFNPNTPTELISMCLNSGETVQFEVELTNKLLRENNEPEDIVPCKIYSTDITCETYTVTERPEACNIVGEDIPWEGAGEETFYIDGCKYSVLYNFRTIGTPPNVKQDVQITAVQKLNESCIPPKTDEEIFKIALTEAIQKIIQGGNEFKPQSNSNIKCNDTWRVIQHSCWATYFIFSDEIHSSAKIPCDSDCCARRLRVCLLNGILTVTDLGFAQGSSTFNCSIQTVPSENIPEEASTTPECEDLNCDIFADLDEHVPWNYKEENEIIYNNGPSPKEVNMHPFENNKSLMIYQFNHNNDRLEIYVKETKLNNIDLSIIDLNGKIVKSKEFSNLTNDINLNVDISNLKSGTYIFRFTNGNKIYSTNKFQVVR